MLIGALRADHWKSYGGGEKLLSCTNTVESLFRGHPCNRGKCSLNRGWGLLIINQQRKHTEIIINLSLRLYMLADKVLTQVPITSTKILSI